MPAVDLSGLPIAITGGSSGIGAATALACARAGMPVVVGARRSDKLKEVVERIRGEGGRASAVECDVTRAEDCRRLIDETVSAFGSVYAVFANAGYGAEASLTEMPDEAVREMFETNFFGTLNTVRPAVERMREAGRGHVLICSSCVARMTLPKFSVYTATKAAQAHVGSAMRAELRGSGVHVSTVHPIATRSEFFEQVRARKGGVPVEHEAPDFFTQRPEDVAARVIACLRRPRGEVWTGPKGWLTRFGMSVCTLFPTIGDMAGRMAVDTAKAERVGGGDDVSVGVRGGERSVVR